MFFLLGILCCAVTIPVFVHNKEFVYPQGYEEVSKARVDELREIHEVFSIICNESDHNFNRRSCDEAVKELENVYLTGQGDEYIISLIATQALDKIIPDPVKCIHLAKEVREKAKVKIEQIRAQRSNSNN